MRPDRMRAARRLGGAAAEAGSVAGRSSAAAVRRRSGTRRWGPLQVRSFRDPSLTSQTHRTCPDARPTPDSGRSTLPAPRPHRFRIGSRRASGDAAHYLRRACAPGRGRGARRRWRRPGRADPRRSIRPRAASRSPRIAAGTDASAIACLRIGLQPWLVARPTWRPRREDRDRGAVDARADRRRQALRVVQAPRCRTSRAARPTSRRAGPPAAARARARDDRRNRPCRS